MMTKLQETTQPVIEMTTDAIDFVLTAAVPAKTTAISPLQQSTVGPDTDFGETSPISTTGMDILCRKNLLNTLNKTLNP